MSNAKSYSLITSCLCSACAGDAEGASMPQDDVHVVALCRDHFCMLRDAIYDRGMKHMVARSGPELVEKLESRTDEATPTDPLWHAVMTLTSGATDLGFHSGCPVCWFSRQQWIANHEPQFIVDTIANTVFQGFIEKGWLKIYHA